MKTIGRILRSARRDRARSQASLARELGVSQQYVSAVERGKGSIEQVVRVCRALGVEVRLEVGGQPIPLVHPIDPGERKDIEENIAWFSRLEPLERLRAIEMHARAAARLRQAGGHGG